MNRLKDLRRQRGMSQEDLGSLLGVQKAAVCKYEVGRVPLPNDVLVKLCDLFDVTSDYLLGRDEMVTPLFKQRPSLPSGFLPVQGAVGVLREVVVIGVPAERRSGISWDGQERPAPASRSSRGAPRAG